MAVESSDLQAKSLCIGGCRPVKPKGLDLGLQSSEVLGLKCIGGPNTGTFPGFCVIEATDCFTDMVALLPLSFRQKDSMPCACAYIGQQGKAAPTTPAINTLSHQATKSLAQSAKHCDNRHLFPEYNTLTSLHASLQAGPQLRPASQTTDWMLHSNQSHLGNLGVCRGHRLLLPRLCVCCHPHGPTTHSTTQAGNPVLQPTATATAKTQIAACVFSIWTLQLQFYPADALSQLAPGCSTGHHSPKWQVKSTQ